MCQLSVKNSVTFFLHDSLHEYDQMMWEYVSAFVNMESGGVIVSDDILFASPSPWWRFLSDFGLSCFIDLANPSIGATVVRHG